MLTVFTAPEAIGSKRNQTIPEPRSEHVRQGLDVIAGGDNRTRFRHHLLNVWHTHGLVWVQATPALGLESLTSQLHIARDTPYIRLYTVLLRKNLLCAKGFVEDRATAEQIDDRASGGRCAVFVNSPQNTLSEAFDLRDLRMGVVLVVDRDVVEAVFTILIHPLQTVLHD